ncbi:TnsD family Tn7-like transposition protein [Ureibacillus thermosphaericus]|uniref:TnsD family Tn7-like transposition protein n=1 Tax=Ureibacillus thermosphaericus TaxID=51173 RepID=UPI0030C98960
MIGYFPNPYPDEMIYSIIARYHLIANRTDTYRDLFRFGNPRIRTDFFYYASELEKLLSHFNFYNAEEILSKFTFFEYHIKFLNPYAKNKLSSALLENKNRAIAYRVFGYSLDMYSDVHLKYCNKCYEEDLSINGEPYWRISHNLPGIKICIKHDEFLNNSTIKMNSSKLVPLSQIKCEESQFRKIINTDYKKLKLINQLILDLFEFKGNLENTRTLYIAYLYELGYIMKGFDDVKLIKDFINFYSDELFELLNINIEQAVHFIITYINGSLKYLHPLIHILFLVFCKKNINDLTNFGIQIPIKAPFCKNPGCTEFNNKKQLENYTLDDPNNVNCCFVCNICDFEYWIEYENQSEYKILNYCASWLEYMVTKLYEEDYSIEQFCKEVQINVKQLEKLGDYRENFNIKFSDYSCARHVHEL